MNPFRKRHSRFRRLANFSHETTTFSPEKTSIDDFEKPDLETISLSTGHVAEFSQKRGGIGGNLRYSVGCDDSRRGPGGKLRRHVTAR